MAIHCMLLTGDNIRIVQNFLSEFKDKYDCMQTFDMVRSMISAWQSANFKDGEEPTMPTKDEIEQFIQSQLGKNKQSTVASVQEYSNEEQSIIDKAKKNGTFMKAPNGKPTNLTEKQWIQVRTKAFKDWFGDWEKIGRAHV